MTRFPIDGGICKALTNGFPLSRSKPLPILFVDGSFESSDLATMLSSLVTANTCQIEIGQWVIRSLNSNGWKKLEAALCEAKNLDALKVIIAVESWTVTSRKYYNPEGGRKEMLEDILQLWQTTLESSKLQLSLSFYVGDAEDFQPLIDILHYPFSKVIHLQEKHLLEKYVYLQLENQS